MNRDSFDFSNQTRPPLTVYLAATVVLFVLTLSAADSIGFVPDYIDGTQPLADAATSTEFKVIDVNSLPVSDLPMLGDDQTPAPVEHKKPASVGVNPTRIIISAIGMDLPVQNPSTTDVDALDALLQKGPARYVNSAKLGEAGNMIIFAHSSHLPVIHNQMFKAFNRIPELSAGDSITLIGADGTKYLYSVNSVRKANADDATISLATTNTKLTLVTCDTLTNKSARFILDADYIGRIDQ
jgi:LPXTG-site transpeptidase (sortase) family protein